MAKDYSKYQKSQPARNNEQRKNSYNIKTPFRSNPDDAKIMNIPIHKIVEFREKSPFDSYIGTEKFNTLVRDIEENGIITPISVRELEDGNYENLAGSHRLAAAEYLHLATVPAFVYPVNTSDNKAMMIHINTNILNGRDELSFIEKVNAMVEYEKTLENQRGLRSDRKENGEKFDRYQQLADVFNIGNKTTAIQYLKAGKEMPEEILRLVAKQFVPFSVAYKIMIQDVPFRDELYEYLRRGNKLTTKSLESLINEYKNRDKEGISETVSEPVQHVEAGTTTVSAEEDKFEGFQTMDEFDLNEVAGHEDLIEEKIGSNDVVSQKKEPLLKVSDFESIINTSNTRKRKKTITLKIEKDLIPGRFLNMDDERKSDLIVTLLREWEKKYYN